MTAFSLLVHAAMLAGPAAPYPFTVGENLQYNAKLGYLPVGTATVSVSRMARERGDQAFVFALTGQGGAPGIRVRYELTSWVGTKRFASLRFYRRLVQGTSIQEERYQIVPDSSRYRQEGGSQDWVAPRDAIDELGFLYYLRTVPLEVGKSYSFSRYFKTGYNPILVRVTGRESLALPGGRIAPCLAVEVTARGQTMGVRFTDDARRLPVSMDLPLPYGSVTLELASMSP